MAITYSGTPRVLGLRATASAMVAPGKGILAADESVATATKRLDGVGGHLDRRQPAGLPGDAAHDPGAGRLRERRHPLRRDAPAGNQRAARPSPSSSAPTACCPASRSHTGASLAGHPGETVTEGLDGLRERVAEYDLARRATFRQVAGRDHHRRRPPEPGLRQQRPRPRPLWGYARKAGLVPIVEPEVLMDGDHTIEACGAGHRRGAPGGLRRAGPQSVDTGRGSGGNRPQAEHGPRREGVAPVPSTVTQVAGATIRCLRAAPSRRAVPGIALPVRVDGRPKVATAHLDCNEPPRAAPVAAHLLLRAGPPGPGAGRLGGRRRRLHRGRPVGAVPPGPLQRGGPLRLAPGRPSVETLDVASAVR